jgi:hypothetical protein
MKILLPDNIFTRILSPVFTEKDIIKLRYFPSGLLSKKTLEIKNAIGLIPTMDLLNHKELFISHSLGVSFDESIGNSYIYFDQKEKLVDEIVLGGDVSTNEAILTKILFSENYGIDVHLSIEKTNGGSSSKNHILVGDRNFIEDKIDSGLSFTEEMIELTSAPYVNFVFASESDNELKKFHSKYGEIISELNPTEVFENNNEGFTLLSKNYLVENLQHVVFNFDEQDLEGMKQLLHLPYYRGIITDLIDVKFV